MAHLDNRDLTMKKFILPALSIAVFIAGVLISSAILKQIAFLLLIVWYMIVQKHKKKKQE